MQSKKYKTMYRWPNIDCKRMYCVLGPFQNLFILQFCSFVLSTAEQVSRKNEILD